MCGFTGCFSFKSINPQDIEEVTKLLFVGSDNQKNISGKEGITLTFGSTGFQL